MPASQTLRDRLPSALGAVALQLAVAALLLLSFRVVRQVVQEKETVFFLRPLARPARAPMVIDARRNRPRPTTAAPDAGTPTIQPPFPSTPPQDATALTAPGGDGNCRIENYGNLGPEDRRLCDRARGTAPPARAAAPLTPPPVADEKFWEAERAASRAPPRVPCVSLTNNVLGEGGFQREDHGARLDLTCALEQLQNGFAAAPLPRRDGVPDPNAPPPHASDEAFRKALQAVKDRRRALSGRPAPAAGGTP